MTCDFCEAVLRIVTFHHESDACVGFVLNDRTLFPLTGTPFAQLSVTDLLEMSVRGRQDIVDAVTAGSQAVSLPLDEVQLLPPLSRPGKIICLGLNYFDHAAESGHEKPEYPSFFLRTADSLIGAGQPIVRPACSEQLDYEAELAVIMGKRCRHAAPEEALSYVGGYSCFNDGSIRDFQHKTSQWTIGKNFDATGAFGPVIVTADEMPPGASGLKISTRLNGKILQQDNTANMVFTVAEAIAMLSRCMTLFPGDVIAMGTPAGVGSARRPPIWMRHGDTVEVAIEGIGHLRNPICDEGERTGQVPGRTSA